jgi:hypothetical protein
MRPTQPYQNMNKHEQIQALHLFANQMAGTLIGDWLADQVISISAATAADLPTSVWTDGLLEWLRAVAMKETAAERKQLRDDAAACDSRLAAIEAREEAVERRAHELRSLCNSVLAVAERI